jgi:hypothetical protein
MQCDSTDAGITYVYAGYSKSAGETKKAAYDAAADKSGFSYRYCIEDKCNDPKKFLPNSAVSAIGSLAFVAASMVIMFV